MKRKEKSIWSRDSQEIVALFFIREDVITNLKSIEMIIIIDRTMAIKLENNLARTRITSM